MGVTHFCLLFIPYPWKRGTDSVDCGLSISNLNQDCDIWLASLYRAKSSEKNIIQWQVSREHKKRSGKF